MTSGDEGFPQPIWIDQKDYHFRLYATMDCVFIEPDRIHILDFKTGKSVFDQRQALVYLLAARYLYPNLPAVASFYNLERCKKSALITVTKSQLDTIENHLALVAQQHQRDLHRYQQNPREFSQIFPPNPGSHCRYCPFRTICDSSALKPSK